jgi:hypothetical protein
MQHQNSARYIDIVSQRRNRIAYPNPCDFVIPVYNTANNSSSAFQAVDPVADSAPFVTSTTQAGSTVTDIVLNASSSAIIDFYVDDYIQIGTEYRIITAYDPTTFTATVNTAFSVAPAPGTLYYLRGGIPMYSGALVGGNQNIVSLDAGASSINDAYKGQFIYFRTGANTGVTTLIIAYDGTTHFAILGKALPNAIAVGDAYDILQYSRDNFSPMVYSGTNTINQPVCYGIELLYLTVPNKVIKSGYGGTLNDYPYLYVYLYNEGDRHSDKVLYTNNIDAQGALFKVPLGLNLRSETFFTLKDAKCLQTCKFRPNEAMRFRIVLPSGENIVFKDSDSYSPLAPNPLVQVSATFSIKRLDGPTTWPPLSSVPVTEESQAEGKKGKFSHGSMYKG